MQQTWVRSLLWEDPLEKGMATPSSILAWRSMDGEAWRATVHQVAKSQTELKWFSTWANDREIILNYSVGPIRDPQEERSQIHRSGGGSVNKEAERDLKMLSPKGNQSWIFIEGTDAEAPILWLPDTKSQLIGKDPDAGKDRGKRRKGQQRMRGIDSISNSIDMNMKKLRAIQRTVEPGVLQSTRSQRVRHNFVMQQ